MTCQPIPVVQYEPLLWVMLSYACSLTYAHSYSHGLSKPNIVCEGAKGFERGDKRNRHADSIKSHVYGAVSPNICTKSYQIICVKTFYHILVPMSGHDAWHGDQSSSHWTRSPRRRSKTGVTCRMGKDAGIPPTECVFFPDCQVKDVRSYISYIQLYSSSSSFLRRTIACRIRVLIAGPEQQAQDQSVARWTSTVSARSQRSYARYIQVHMPDCPIPLE